MRTYKHAYFDLQQWKDLLAKLASERGDDLELCYYNDRPGEHRASALNSEPSREDIEAALLRTGDPQWTELPFFNERLMITVDDAPNAVTVTVLADCGFVPRAEMEALARRMEAVAVAAASEPETMTGVAVVE